MTSDNDMLVWCRNVTVQSQNASFYSLLKVCHQCSS